MDTEICCVSNSEVLWETLSKRSWLSSWLSHSQSVISSANKRWLPTFSNRSVLVPLSAIVVWHSHVTDARSVATVLICSLPDCFGKGPSTLTHCSPLEGAREPPSLASLRQHRSGRLSLAPYHMLFVFKTQCQPGGLGQSRQAFLTGYLPQTTSWRVSTQLRFLVTASLGSGGLAPQIPPVFLVCTTCWHSPLTPRSSKGMSGVLFSIIFLKI